MYNRHIETTNINGVLKMITFNNKKYAKNDKEFTAALFQAGGTCNGFYKLIKRGVYLYNMQNEVQCFIRFHNDRMIMQCTLKDNGKKWYSYLQDSTEHWLGLRDSNNNRIVPISNEWKLIVDCEDKYAI